MELDEIKSNRQLEYKESMPIMHLFKCFIDQIEKSANNALKDLDVTLAQGHVLRILKKSGGCATMKQVEQEFKVAQSTTVGIISRLEKKGFVEISSHEKDKRIKIVSLTDTGKEQLISIKKRLDEMENELFKDFKQEEKQQLRAFVNRAFENILET